MTAQAERTATACPLGCGELRADPTPIRENRYGLPYELRIGWCSSCGLGVTLDAPPADELAGLYAREYPGAGRVPASGRLARAWHAVNASLPIVDRVRTGPVLDVGCGAGDALVALGDRGLEVTGLEPNPRAAEVARGRGLNVIGEPIEDADLPDGAFASVIASQVLEHVFDPHLVLKKLRSALRHDGVVYLAVPNAASAWRRLFRRHWAHWHVPFHLYHHTVSSLRRLCGQCGLELATVRTFTPGEYVLMSVAAWRNARRGRYAIEPFHGQYGRRLLLAPPARLLDALGRGDAIYAEAVRAD